MPFRGKLGNHINIITVTTVNYDFIEPTLPRSIRPAGRKYNEIILNLSFNSN